MRDFHDYRDDYFKERARVFNLLELLWATDHTWHTVKPIYLTQHKAKTYYQLKPSWKESLVNWWKNDDNFNF